MPHSRRASPMPNRKSIAFPQIERQTAKSTAELNLKLLVYGPGTRDRSLALSAFGFRELARCRFLRFFYFCEIFRFCLAQLIVLEVGVCLVPGLRIEIFLELLVLEKPAVTGVYLVSKNSQVLCKQGA